MGKQYAKTKIFYFKDKIASLPQDSQAITAPIHVRIKPTNSCNHRCNYCAYRAEQLQLGKDMVIKDFIPKEKMKEILDDVNSMGVKAVTFSGGGEPFCYPFFLDAVKKIATMPIKFRSYTNGSRLEGEIAEIFAKRGSWLRVSMDGWDDKSYSDYRGVRDGEYTKIMSNIMKFKSIGGTCNLGASLIIDKKNYSHIFEMIKNLKEAGVDSIKVSPCIISDDGGKNNEYHDSIFEKVKKQIGESIDKLEDKNFEIFDSYNREVTSFKKDYSWCPYIQIRPVIGADLNVYACQD
ncbi:MAG: radical SAM protein, partial [Nanoarchaeota archaeon]